MDFFDIAKILICHEFFKIISMIIIFSQNIFVLYTHLLLNICNCNACSTYVIYNTNYKSNS